VDLCSLRDSSIDDDLGQRDFTINSLALDVSGWWNLRVPHLLDPLGGIADLKAGRLRLCSQTSLSDDPLRILRGYRLVSTYGFVFTAQTHKNIVQGRTGLNQVAVERIRDELMLILGARNSVSVLRMLNEDDLLKLLLPEYEDMGNLQQNHSHHEDPWQPSLSALEALEFLLINIPQLLGNYGDEASAILAQTLGGKRSRQTLLKLAVLLQNIGKTHNKSPGKDDAIHYDGHEVARTQLAASLCSRLRLSNKEINFVGQLVGQHNGSVHLFDLTPPSMPALCSFFRLGPELFWPLLLLFAANYRASQNPTAAKGDLQPLPQLIQGWLDFYHERLKPREMEPPIVSGHDLMEYLDLSPGPLVGKLLKYLAELQWEGRLSTQEEALAQAARLLKEMKLRSQKAGDRGQQADCS
jgi:tRNA nucleotidyltransferase/poly(A) polymerase